MGDKRRENLCKKEKVFDACQIVCGDCCADDMTRTFIYDGNGEDCDWLWSEKRKTEQCVRPQVNSMCAATCGRCCSNDKTFTFDIGTAFNPKPRKCGWFGKKKKGEPRSGAKKNHPSQTLVRNHATVVRITLSLRQTLQSK